MDKETQIPTLSKTAVSSMPLYTKGRWYLQTRADAYTNIIRCDSGKGFESEYIASTSQIPVLEEQANAQLMAAAPDLLEALQELMQVKEWKDKYGKDEQYLKAQPIAWNNAKEAIEKALTIEQKVI